MEKMQKRLGNYIYEERNVGSGQFSEVFVGYEMLTQERVAVKQIDCSKMRDQVMLQMMRNEIDILRLIPKNVNILKLFDVFQNGHFVYIITEYCNQGDLQQLISGHAIPEERAIDLIIQILNALQHCKNNCTSIVILVIIHRDIKPANIFLCNGIPKLADFGFALCKNVNNGVEIQNYNVGTPIYMAPETIINNHYSFKSDIWSAGVVLYEMIFGQQPFRSNTEPELINKLKIYQQNGILYYPNQCSRFLDVLIQNMLQYDKNQRWNVEKCLEYLKQWQQPRFLPQQPTTSTRIVQSQQQHVRSITPVQYRQPTQPQQVVIPRVPQYQQFKISTTPLSVTQSASFSQLPQYIYYSNYQPQPHSPYSREPLQQLNGSNALKTQPEKLPYFPVRFPSVQRERNATIQDISQRSNVEPSQQNAHSLPFANLLYKIAKLFINTTYFEVFSQNRVITKSECMFIQLKIQYCLLQCCHLLFPPTNPCLPECTVRLLNVKQTILQMRDLYLMDARFMSLYNNPWTLDNIFELLKDYLFIAIHMFNDFLTRDCTNAQMIIILDYLVILILLLKRFQKCSSWVEFDKRNNVSNIVQAPINQNANSQQWSAIRKIIQRDIVR